MSPFEIMKWIETKQRPQNAIDERDGYNPFIINKGFSYFPDLIFFANEMNKGSNFNSDPLLQFNFYYHLLPRRKPRFEKWVKPKKEEELNIIMEYYSYSREKAKQVMGIIDNKQLKLMEKELEKGGAGIRKK
jgi:hypothetical protein